MKRLTQEEITEFNSKLTSKGLYNQGIFFEANGVPTYFKGQHTIMTQWTSGGVSGGNCWDEGHTEYSYSYDEEGNSYEAGSYYVDPHESYRNDPEPTRWSVLEDLILLYNITDKEVRGRIYSAIDENTDYDYEYYGNHTEYTTEFIPLETFYAIIGI